MNELIHVGLGGAIALLILREVFNFLNKRKPAKNPSDPHHTKLGDVSTAYWLDIFGEMKDNQRMMIEKLTVIETLLKTKK